MKRVLSLVTLAVMGVPVWVVLASALQYEPASLLVHVEEPGVQVFLGGELLGVAKGSQAVGPVDVEPGDHRVRVVRDGLTVFSRMVKVAEGQPAEVWARWRDDGGTLAAKNGAAGPEQEQEQEQEQVPDLDAAARTLDGHRTAVTAVGFAGHARALRLVSAGAGGELRTWDAASGRVDRALPAHFGRVAGLCVLADGRHVLTVGSDQILRVWDLESGCEVRSLEVELGSPVRALAASPDGRLAAVGCEGGTVRVIDLASGGDGFQIPVSPAAPASLGFSPDGKTLLVGVVGGPDGAAPVHVWDVVGRKPVGRLAGHAGSVWSLAFLPDGRRAVSAGSDATMRLWDVAAGTELKRLGGHPGAVFSVAVSNDGRYALTGTGHRWAGGWRDADAYGVQVWDLETGRALGRLNTRGPVHSVALSPDGRTALAGGEDGLVRSWALPTTADGAIAAATPRRAPVALRNARGRDSAG